MRAVLAPEKRREKKLKQSQENDDHLPGSQIKYYSTRTTALEHSPPIYGKISARNRIETNGYFLVKKLDRVYRLACRSIPWQAEVRKSKTVKLVST